MFGQQWCGWWKQGQNDAPWTLDHICSPEQNCPHCPHLAPAATRELTGRRVWTRTAAVEYWSETLLPAKLNNWQRIDQRIIAPRCAALVWPGIMDTTLSIFTSISVSILCPWFNNINEMCKEEHEKVIRHEIQIPRWPLFFVRWFIDIFQNEHVQTKGTWLWLQCLMYRTNYSQLKAVSSCLH